MPALPESSTPDLLTVVVDAIVPADDYPSASQAGGVEFLHRLVETDRPDWRRRMNAVVARVDAFSWRAHGNGFAGLTPDQRQRVLDELAGDAEFDWFAGLVNYGYYAPDRAGRPPVSWTMIDWSPEPEGGWPKQLPDLPYRRSGLISLEQIETRYDAVVIGSGAGGGAVAQVLAESGRRVLIVEAGEPTPTARLAGDHLRNPRVNLGLESLAGPLGPGHPRAVDIDGDRRIVDPTDPRWGNNAFTVGGGTRVYGAQAWRFSPLDFTMATHYGVPEGSSLADWPIRYEDLEPYYSRAEQQFGVSGRSGGDPWAGPRSAEFPMPPVSGIGNPALLADAAGRLGWGTLPVPLLINSTEYGGRAACRHCGQCVGFACPVEAKSGSHNSSIPAALATGNGFLLTGTTAERLITDGSGRVTGVALAGISGPSVRRSEVQAEEVVLAAGAIESARLLLASRSDREPDGLGNDHDQVGRHLQGHVYAGALGVFDDPVADLAGPGPSIASCDFRHDNRGVIGGGMIANEFVPTPISSYGYLTAAGLIPSHGPGAKQGMRDLTRRMLRVVGPIQEMTNAESRVRLDERVRDRFGNPAAVLSGEVHPEDIRARDFLGERAMQWLSAAGARQLVATPPGGSRPSGPSSGQHQAGTCRMGTDPARSVTDPYGRVWGHPNVRVADGSLHVTNGGVNPVLSILAGALRVADLMVG